MKYTFSAEGHHNISAKHKSTLEFTKDTSLTPKGDCILGVNANFKTDKVQNLIKYANKNNIQTVQVTISINQNLKDQFTATLNPNFSDETEIVFRTSDVITQRTLGILATKSASQISEEVKKEMKNKNTKMKVTLALP